jgi:Spy/CpxP family protein refolding chaperone
MWRHARKMVWFGALMGTLFLGLALAGLVQAQAPAGPPAGHQMLLTPEDRASMGQIFWHRMQEKLGLSEQQATEIRALLDTQRAAARTTGQEMRTARKQLRGLLDQQTPDAAAVQAAASQIKMLQAAMFDAHLQTQLAVRAKLTPAQWQQWQSLHHGRGHWGRRPGPGFGPGK